jgi:hypothetical protein
MSLSSSLPPVSCFSARTSTSRCERFMFCCTLLYWSRVKSAAMIGICSVAIWWLCYYVDACQWSVVSRLSPAMFKGLLGLYLTRPCGFKNSEYVMTSEVVLLYMGWYMKSPY